MGWFYAVSFCFPSSLLESLQFYDTINRTLAVEMPSATTLRSASSSTYLCLTGPGSSPNPSRVHGIILGFLFGGEDVLAGTLRVCVAVRTEG